MPGIQSFRNVSLPFGKSRREVEPDEETKPREMTEAEKVAAFEAWSKQLLESIEAKGNYFVACTPEQLTELEPEGLEKSRVVKAYIGPSTTPYPELESDGKLIVKLELRYQLILSKQQLGDQPPRPRIDLVIQLRSTARDLKTKLRMSKLYSDM